MIFLIDKIKQKNSGTFKLVDSCDVEYGDGSVEDALDSLNEKVGSSSTTSDVATDDEVTEALNDVFGTSEETSEDDSTEEDNTEG
ncbi:MAG: hypothetical protein LUD12_10145 [Lachnospiraceae bacterium]|nr:hypothetical protein [Lachnospiraceae bacterium]